MSYAIMRMAKIKSKRDVVMTLQHNTRERMPANADPEKTRKNLVHGGTVAESLVRFDGLMPEKVRANAVQAVEMVFTASPEFNGNWGGYLQDALKWGLETFGIDPEKKDIRPAIGYAVHHDESTPHLHLVVVPLKDGKLNARHFIGGARERMAELQEDFYQKVGKKYELERGRPREETRARHTPHTLAATAAKLDEREKKVDAAQTAVRELFKGEDPRALKAQVDEFNNRTPEDLRGLAKAIEFKKCHTVGEFMQVMREQKKQQELQQSRGRSR